MREIHEELGIEISVEDFLCTVEYQYPNFYLIMDCYFCSVVSGHIGLTVHDDAKWLKIDELDAVRWLPADVMVVDRLKEKVIQG